ncbi:hypothetical protein Hdeb2414_s0822g00950951 [Helianthus debilis subsp. tardiflorus]
MANPKMIAIAFLVLFVVDLSFAARNSKKTGGQGGGGGGGGGEGGGGGGGGDDGVMGRVQDTGVGLDMERGMDPVMVMTMVAINHKPYLQQ